MVIEMKEWIWELQKKIMQKAIYDPENAEQLRIDNAFGSPASFFYNAERMGYCKKVDVEEAQKEYGELWNFRGD